jgi:hypothetical protein
MDRLTGIDQEALEIQRAEQVAAAATEDTDLPPEARRDRAEVIAGSILKRDDDIVWAGVPMRVVGPARDEDFLIGRYDPWCGNMLLPVNWQDISDRAPADPNDTSSLPIFPEEQLQARIAASAAKKAHKEPAHKVEHDQHAALRALIQRLPHKEQKHAREVFKQHGLLGKDD